MFDFTLPGDVDLAEYAASFETPDQLAEFILDDENDSPGFWLLREYFLEYRDCAAPERTNWLNIALELGRYSELPHASLIEHGLYPVFRAAADLLHGSNDGVG